MYAILGIVGTCKYGNLEHGNLGIWSMGNLNTCASVTLSLGDNLTQSIKKNGYLKMWKTYGNYGDLQR